MAGTNRTKKINLLPSPVIILCEPQLGQNIGTAARAMANFGLWDLRLVNPRDGWPSKEAASAAAKADHIIERVKIFATLKEAVADLSLIYATTARKRDMYKPVIGPEKAAEEMVMSINKKQGVGILFGRERWGLKNEEIAICDAIITLPVEEAFASLNIAQAVLILAYEWRRKNMGSKLPFSENIGEPVSKGEMIALFEHLESSLQRAGFFITEEKRPSMVNNIRAMLTKARFNKQEAQTFRGIIASLDGYHERNRKKKK